ncbi:MAG TPA: hypothetical protein VE176_05230 [Candidatus Limnocylindrales bacterium]|nr:hypothetical protein [Candidatus Limnocylindrales bacterium]
MNNEAMKEVLNELFSHLEKLETQSEAILQFLKEKKRVTDKQLAPYLEQAGNASSVKWRAARVRIEKLLSPEHPEKEIKLGKKPELHEEPGRAGASDADDADSVADLAGDKRESGDIGDKKPEPRNAGPTDANLRDKEKSKPAEGAQASPADGKMDKSQEQSEVEAARDQREPKSELAHHPSEVTSELAKQEAR